MNIWVSGLIFLTIIITNVSQASEIKSINFYQKDSISYFEFAFGEEVPDPKKFTVRKDKQIIIDFPQTIASKKVMRGFDASEFDGSVVYMSIYNKPDKKDDIRVNVQLRDNVRSMLQQNGNIFVLKVENRFGAFSDEEVAISERKKVGKKDDEIQRLNIPKSDNVVDILENLTLAGKKKYIGKKISLDVRDVKVETVLRMISDASGFNVILTEDVEKLPGLTLNLVNVPWDQALDTVLKLNNLVARKNGIILMVTTMDQATKEKQRELSLQKMMQTQENLVAKIFPISFADIADLKTILEPYLTPNRGKISVDNRTNSIILRDTALIIEKIKKIIEVLDTQTPQVLIESKIVEVQEGMKKEIGLSNQGFTFGYDPVGLPSTTGATIGDASTSAGQSGPGFQFSSAPTFDTANAAATNMFNVGITRYGRMFNLNFALRLAEEESKVKIVSSPKVITQNKQKATISSKDTTSFIQTSGVGAQATTSFQQTDAVLNLDVTPQVTNDGSISMEISFDKEQFGKIPSTGAPPNKSSRSVKTNVLVDNGATIVIGGIYSYEKRENHSGIPFLKDIPLVGWLFRTAFNPSMDKNEMIIFITPRVINQEEAGLTTGSL